MFFCFRVLLGGLLWCGGLLWLLFSAVVYRCDLMCKLIKLHIVNPYSANVENMVSS